ncbi:SPOR domain-containing protein [Fundidesulfovibrio putealis]|uniref:SPOR domain-containing protein n=1 Tax=Fundidesulfovibrio putealis TaxID=270496 RepID=UPI000415BBBD|nr:SPOR domain-containing protein [Fundidesulfovibrio putealis]
MKVFAQRQIAAAGMLAALFVIMSAGRAPAQAQAPQDWQVRGVCDLRKGAGGTGRRDECIQVAAEVLMLLPEKAGPGNVALLAEFTDNLEKAGASWDAPCRDPKHCPDTAYTIRYAFVSRKVLTIPRDKIFTALVCREGFSETAPDDAACRLKLMKVLREMVMRARKEGALLAVLKCGGAETEAVRPDGAGVAGYELVYAFVQLPDMLPMAGNDPKAAAKFGVDQLVEPQEDVAASGPAKPKAVQANGPAPAATPAAKPSGTAPPAQASAPAVTPGPAAQAPASGQGSGPTPAAQAPAASWVMQPLATGEIVMQVAALPSLVQAETVADRLSGKGIEAGFERAEVNGKEVYRVLARGSGSPEAFRQKLAEMGYPGAIQRR